METSLLRDIAKEYGTPLYVYDGNAIEKQYEKLRSCLPENFQVFYSMKANPLMGICQLFEKLGCRIEVASEGELYIALASGFKPDEIIFTSPGKTYEEIEYAINEGVFSINIESAAEAHIISRVAEQKGKHVNISLRINPDFDVSGAGIKMTGVPTQFGIDQGQAAEAVKEIKKLPNIDIIGIHIYTGTQALNSNNIVANMEEVIKLALEVSKSGDFDLKFLDLGGGFGIPYFQNEKDLDLELLKSGLEEVMEKYSDSLKDTVMAVESGRFLMAESGLYLTKILYTKENKGRKYLICDGGSNQHANSAFLGRHVRNNFPMEIVGGCGEVEEVNTVGPLCTPTDVMGQRVSLPKAGPEDILSIIKSGAYGLTDSPVLFLSHPIPAEVIYYQGKISILRERGKKEDLLRGQKSLF